MKARESELSSRRDGRILENRHGAPDDRGNDSSRAAAFAKKRPLPDRVRNRPTITLDGVTFDAITEVECAERIVLELAAGRGGWIITSNLDHLRRARRDGTFRHMLERADLVVADGMPLVWASRLRGTPLEERVAGSSLISTVAGAASATGRSVFLLGGDPGTADGAARVLQASYPSLKVAGAFCPPLGFDQSERDMDELADLLRRSRADIVFVALGSPKQERVIAMLRESLPDAWWMGVGISFSFLCGRVRRAPHWMQEAGLEWVHRLAQEPRRLAKRYLIFGIPFGVRFLLRASLERFGGRNGRRERQTSNAGRREPASKGRHERRHA